MRRQRLLLLVVVLVVAALVTFGLVVAAVRYTPSSQTATSSLGVGSGSDRAGPRLEVPRGRSAGSTGPPGIVDRVS